MFETSRLNEELSRARLAALRRQMEERDLGNERFIRIRRSIIVSLDRIHGLELQAGGEYAVVLNSKARLRLSRRYRKRLQDRMDAMSVRD